MEKRFKKGEAAYLCVRVERVLESNDVYDYTVAYTNYGTGGNSFIAVIKEQLLTVDEVADESGIDWQGTFNEYSEKAQRKIEALTKQLEEANETIKAFSESEDIVRTNFDAKADENKELKARNAELEALLKEVMATRDEAIKQNDELITENKKLKADCNEWKDTANERLNAVQTLSAERNKVMAGVDELKNTLVDRTKDVQNLTEENAKLKTDLDQRNKDFDAMKKDRDNILADSKRTTEWYMEANRTATEAAEANDDLKAKIADLRNRVGEQLAQIQDLTSEVHFHKEYGEGLDKQQKELQARYDELDSVNKEQAEKIRRQDKALTDLKKRNDALQTDNANLNFLLEAQPEKGAARKVHVITNDGKEYMFRKCTKASFDNYNDFTVLKIYEGDTYVAGFLRGDSPENFAAWWTE